MFSFKLSKYEAINSLKMFFWWWLALAGTGLLFASVFNSLKSQSNDLDKVMQALNPQILQAFNISPSGYLNTVESFLSGQFASVFSLSGAILSIIIGVGLIGAKIENKTIVFWLSKNISRLGLYFTKFLTQSLVFTLANLLIAICMYFSFYFLSNQKEISKQYFIVLFLACNSLFVTMLSFGMFLGLIFNRSKAQAIGISIVALSWVLNALSTLGDYPNWAKYISVFYFLDLTQIRDKYEIDPYKLLILGAVSIVFLIAGILIFRRKNIYA